MKPVKFKYNSERKGLLVNNSHEGKDHIVSPSTTISSLEKKVIGSSSSQKYYKDLSAYKLIMSDDPTSILSTKSAKHFLQDIENPELQRKISSYIEREKRKYFQNAFTRKFPANDNIKIETNRGFSEENPQGRKTFMSNRETSPGLGRGMRVKMSITTGQLSKKRRMEAKLKLESKRGTKHDDLTQTQDTFNSSIEPSKEIMITSEGYVKTEGDQPLANSGFEFNSDCNCKEEINSRFLPTLDESSKSHIKASLTRSPSSVKALIKNFMHNDQDKEKKPALESESIIKKFINHNFKGNLRDRLKTFEKFAFSNSERDEHRYVLPVLNEIKTFREPTGTMMITDLWARSMQRECLEKANMIREKKILEKYLYYKTKIETPDDEGNSKQPVLLTAKEEKILKGKIENEMKDEEYYKKKRQGHKRTIQPFEIGKTNVSAAEKMKGILDSILSLNKQNEKELMKISKSLNESMPKKDPQKEEMKFYKKLLN